MAIEGLEEASPNDGVVGVGGFLMLSVKKRVMADHIARHVVCPFEDLGADVDHEGVG
jgi:hypothetical protein